MRPYKGECPACGKKKAMKAVKEFNGREWAGSLCRFCAYFLPDIQSQYYDLACASCGTAMGVKSLDYEHHEPNEELIQKILAAENARAAMEKNVLDTMIAAAETVKSVEVRASIEKDIEARKALNLHVPRDLKLKQSWDKRHAEHLSLYHCSDCHKKRREKGVDVETDESYVRYTTNCDICKKPMNWLDFPEDIPLDRQIEQVSRERHLHAGDCTTKHDEIIRIIRETEKAKAAVSGTP